MKNKGNDGSEHLLTGFFNYMGFVAITFLAVAITMYLLYGLCAAMVPSIASAASKEDYLLLVAQIAVMYLVLRNISRVAVGIRNWFCEFVGIPIYDSTSAG